MATLLASGGVGRGDSVVVMLGNQVELWESMLAVIKLGAVIMPTTTAIGTTDLADRLERGAARGVICNAADTAKFAGIPGDYARFVVGGPADARAAGDWQPYAAAYGLGDVSV